MSDRAPAGQILTGAEVAAGNGPKAREERPDVCIIGSGAGGAVMAAQLAERGVRVLVLEEGAQRRLQDFQMKERTAFAQLYREQGQRGTSDLAIAILQGRALGGGSLVSWTSCLRIPDQVLVHWRAIHGVEGLDPATLAPHFSAVEHRLRVREQPVDQVNANNRVLLDGAGKLGLTHALVRRNVEGCANLGYCGMGCPVGAKMSADQTWLRDAVEKGARVFTETQAVRIETKGRRAVVVHARVLDPERDHHARAQLVIRPKLVVLACGAIETPTLLLRSRIEGRGRVGRRTFLHPTLLSLAAFRRPIEGYSGAPQSVASYHFSDRGAARAGFFLQAVPVHPAFIAAAAAGFGQGHQDLMSRLGHLSALAASVADGLLPDDEGGTVTLRKDGRSRLDYPIRPDTWEALREANKVLARIQLAAGAERVWSPHEPPEVLLHPDDVSKLDAAPWEPGRVSLLSTQPMGGCAMGKDRESSVVDSRLKLHDLDNVYVVDGSVFPSGLGVGPQETVMALGHWAAEHVAASIR
jgi:choline dehydrogenase-like flavoprotein